MAWLKYTPVFKHGYGTVGYREIYNMAFLDDLKYSIRDAHGDPEGLREPLWEIVDYLPLHLLHERIETLEDNIESTQKRLERYRDMLKDGEYSD